MARYPAARQRIISGATSEPVITPTQVVLHTAVGEGSPHDYFDREAVVVESHLWVGRDRVEQYQDTGRQADAQALGNARAISVESADNGHPDSDPWTAWQVEQLAQIVAWAHRVHGVPIRACRSWTDPGVGYHRQFEQWNPHVHSCPGDARVHQVGQIVARAQAITAAGTATPPAAAGAGPTVTGGTPEEDDVAWTDKLRMGAGNATVLKALGATNNTITANDALIGAAAQAREANLAVHTLTAQIGALTQLVTSLSTTGVGGEYTAAELEAIAYTGAQKAITELGDRLAGH